MRDLDKMTLTQTAWPQPKHTTLGHPDRKAALADTTTPRPPCIYCGARTNEHIVMCESCGRKMDDGLLDAKDTLLRRKEKEANG